MKTGIVIVNWNAGAQLSDCVASVARYHHGLVSSVIIVDNASTDDSLARVEALNTSGLQLQIIRNATNRGFASACNQGAELADGDYLLFLNPDARLFENSLSAPIAFLEQTANRKVGIVGIQLTDEQGLIARSCARFPTLGIFAAHAIGLNRIPGLRHLNMHLTDWAHDETRAVNHVIGAFYLMRRSLFESLSGFDERFFVYLEDLDLSLRASEAGWRSVYLAEAQAFHAGGGTSCQVKAHRLFYSLRSRLIYGFKHFRPWQAWALVFVTMAVEPFARTIFALIGGGLADVRNTWRAYGMLFGDFRKILENGKQ